jgi:serine/threonine protein kinase
LVLTPTHIPSASAPDLSSAFAGISHGDLYAHNILCNPEGSAFLGDFGAATIYCSGASDVDGESVDSCGSHIHEHIQRIEVRAFGILLSELLAILKDRPYPEITESLSLIATSCLTDLLNQRPMFSAINVSLQTLVGLCEKS